MIAEELYSIARKIKHTKPLILNITNYVTMDIIANALLAIGAAPIMSVFEDELEELIRVASAININIGTLDNNFIKLAIATVKIAKRYNKPIILDPVGAGSTAIRTQVAQELLDYTSVVKGNASEIIALLSSSSGNYGVESMHATTEAEPYAKKFVQDHDIIVVISGAEDLILNKSHVASVKFGSELMTSVTGMGCTLSAVIGAFYAVMDDPFQASYFATNHFGICGEIAARTSDAPSAFKMKFIDAIYSLTLDQIKSFLC